MRSRHGPIQQKRFNILISIKNDLFRCRQNILTITKVEMKALRRKLYEIMHENVPLTIKENEVSLNLTHLHKRFACSNSIT